MVKCYEDTNIKAIADAIRAKNGTSNTYKTSEMAEAVEAIETGGNLDGAIDGSITEVSSNVATIKNYAFRGCNSLTTADFPNVTNVGTYAFYDCNDLGTINFPQATEIGSYAFFNCDELVSVILPEATSIGSNAFSSCDLLDSIDLPKATTISYRAFYLDFILKKVILRADAVCSISGTDIFNKCYHILGEVDENYNPSGLKDGYIYVPSARVNGYKSDSMWVNFASQIRALEDYTVDGTTTGALDESKI
jgi:hypothetical protein